MTFHDQQLYSLAFQVFHDPHEPFHTSFVLLFLVDINIVVVIITFFWLLMLFIIIIIISLFIPLNIDSQCSVEHTSAGKRQLTYLRQEHFPSTEKISNNTHTL